MELNTNYFDLMEYTYRTQMDSVLFHPPLSNKQAQGLKNTDAERLQNLQTKSYIAKRKGCSKESG